MAGFSFGRSSTVWRTVFWVRFQGGAALSLVQQSPAHGVLVSAVHAVADSDFQVFQSTPDLKLLRLVQDHHSISSVEGQVGYV